MQLPQIVTKLIRYGTVTAVSQSILLLSVAFAVEILNYPPTISYVAILTLVYIGVYFASASWVFRKKDHGQQWFRFITAVITFWILNAGLFYVLVELFSIHYLVAAITNLLVLGVLRYLTYSYWVFTSGNKNS